MSAFNARDDKQGNRIWTVFYFSRLRTALQGQGLAGTQQTEGIEREHHGTTVSHTPSVPAWSWLCLRPDPIRSYGH
jgi:hypothetical protein